MTKNPLHVRDSLRRTNVTKNAAMPDPIPSKKAFREQGNRAIVLGDTSFTEMRWPGRGRFEAGLASRILDHEKCCLMTCLEHFDCVLGWGLSGLTIIAEEGGPLERGRLLIVG